MIKSKCSPASPNGPTWWLVNKTSVASLLLHSSESHVVCPRAFLGRGILERNFLAVATCKVPCVGSWDDEMKTFKIFRSLIGADRGWRSGTVPTLSGMDEHANP